MFIERRSDATARAFRLLIGTAAFVVIVAGMKVASTILVPFFLAVFIAIIVSPLYFYLQRRGVHRVLALLVVVFAVMVVGLGLAQLVGTSIEEFTRSLPQYQKVLKAKSIELIRWAGEKGLTVPEESLLQTFDPGAAMKLFGGMLSGLTGVLTNAFLIVITVIFILLEATSFPVKLRTMLKDPEGSMSYFKSFLSDIQHYMAIKTGMSVATGVLVSLWLFILGGSYALLFGLFAFLLNYIPNIGSIIAAVPPILLAIINFGVAKAVVIGMGYLVINISISNFIEPRVMGHGLGLSPLVVFLSLVFWGWVLGVVGMLLAVPLTMTLKIALDSNESTRPLAIILGPETIRPSEEENPDVSAEDEDAASGTGD